MIERAQIHPTAIIEPGAMIGKRARILAFAVVRSGARVCDGAYIGEYVAIGTPPESNEFYPARGSTRTTRHSVVIGRGAVIREHSHVQSGTITPTVVGAKTLVMGGTHIAHDCIIGNEATISSNATFGGFTMIGNHANLGLGVVTHPWTLIGAGAMVGLNSSVIRDVLPFQKVAGSPARLIGSNQHKDASLPAEYDASLVDADAMREWEEMTRLRDELREAWSQR
jgi:UDP-N-acetylglucosamine acyltransferase